MSDDPRRAVRAAEWILWLWAAWVTVLGIYQSEASVKSIEKLVADYLQFPISFNPEALQGVVVAGYVITAALLFWMVVKIGEGRRWARTSLALNFAFDAVFTGMAPYHGTSGYLMAVVDLGAQAIAIYLLYTLPGRLTFQ